MTREQAEMSNAWASEGGKRIQEILGAMINESRAKLEKLYRDPEKLTGKSAAKWAHRMHGLEDFRETVLDAIDPNRKAGR